MKKIVYTVKDELGIHVRPAGLLVKEIQKYESDVTIEKNGKSVSRQARGNNQRNGRRFRRGIRRRRD